MCDDPNDIEKVEALDVLKEEIIDLITNLSCFKLPEPPKTPDSELALQPTGKRRISRDVIGLDLATMPQTRVRSYEIFPILKPPTATDSTALTKKKRPSRVRKPIQSSIVSKLDNSSVANCYTEHDRVPSPRTMPRRCSSPNPKTPIKPKKKQAPLSPCANQKILHMAPKSPSRSPQADIGKAPPMGQMVQIPRGSLSNMNRSPSKAKEMSLCPLNTTISRHTKTLMVSSHRDTCHMGNHRLATRLIHLTPPEVRRW